MAEDTEQVDCESTNQTVQCSAVPCSAVQCSAVQCSSSPPYLQLSFRSISTTVETKRDQVSSLSMETTQKRPNKRFVLLIFSVEQVYVLL